MAARLLQVAIELTSHVLPSAYLQCAWLVLQCTSSTTDATGEAADAYMQGLSAVSARCRSLQEVWPNRQAAKQFVRVRPMYIFSCLKAAGQQQRGAMGSTLS